ncbi:MULTISPECIES: hypothetical protein [Delftia]|uniref:Uncharacterized protein n=1 Tax=Delftia deserti TaxID=1651218 RepID=A0ABW5ENL5_9BURK|nr:MULTISPECIES: hypothetical protein [Delftia]
MFDGSKTLVMIALFWMTMVHGAPGQNIQSPIMLHERTSPNAFPVAIYRGIKVDDFRKLVISSFERARFSHTAIEKSKDGTAQYKFFYSLATGGKIQRIDVVLRVDENLDKSRRCANCFLRLTMIPDLPSLQSSSWMLQYDLSRQVFSAIDQAYADIHDLGRKSMDAEFGFNYQNRWRGERNLYDNSFVGIEPSSLKTTIIDAYSAAGFKLASDTTKDSIFSELTFTFPIAPDQTEGVVYKISVASQLDAGNRCYPCEISEVYDPYQRLPATGLSGMSSRLTLESRFAAARMQALDRLKDGTERYLRPETVFTIPPKPAPLGSPRPQIRPPIVT